ncbi:hypothetical protein HY632_03355 [Candidatus Uhrbacteria bacterium]|nr:hypothetical protein [Candidatus Uhrbacteria bacterium]
MHIVEAFRADLRHLVDFTFTMTKLDATGFHLELRRWGIVVAALDEAWEDVPGGVRWTVTQHVGAVHPILGPISRCIWWRRRDFFDAWLTHNVEEVGCIPEFLPTLYRRETRAAAH